ncbi:hypothetical protein RQP46_007994 [Phenoliferia psychrophenolica]
MASKELANTLGAVLIGTLASFFLCGVVVTSVTSYVKAFPNDRWYLKLVVFVSLILSLADTAVRNTLSKRSLFRDETWMFPPSLKVLLDKITVKNYLFALISSLNARQSGQGLGSSGGVAMGRLTSTKMRRTGDVNVTIVQDVFVDSHELAVGSVPMDDYYRPSRGPVNLQFPGGTARSDEHEGKGWGTAESV